MRKDTAWEDRASPKVHKNPVKNFLSRLRGKNIERERVRERDRQRGCKKKKMLPFFAWCIKASELTALHCLDLGFLHSPSKAL